MQNSTYKMARARQWLGWTKSQPAVSIVMHEDAISMLVLRDRPFRITACGTVPLSVGTVRHGKLRLVGLAADALRALADHLVVSSDARLVAVIAPSTAFADPSSDTIHAALDKYQVDAVTRLMQEAGFSQSRLDPIPAALARAGRVLGGVTGYAAGAGWLTGWVDEVSEATTSGSIWDPMSLGTSPTSLTPVTSPLPVKVEKAVRLDGPWPLLLGGALSVFEERPSSVLTGIAPPAVSGWAVEPIGGMRT